MIGIVVGFVIGAPIWFPAGMIVMGRLCAATRAQQEATRPERKKDTDWEDWARN